MEHCRNCRAPTKLMCSICSDEYFCSSECLSENWDKHRKHCGVKGVPSQAVSAMGIRDGKTVREIFSAFGAGQLPATALFVCSADTVISRPIPQDGQFVTLHWSPDPCPISKLKRLPAVLIVLSPWRRPTFDETTLANIMLAHADGTKSIGYDYQIDQRELAHQLSSMTTMDFVQLLNDVTSFDDHPWLNRILHTTYMKMLMRLAPMAFRAAWTDEAAYKAEGPDVSETMRLRSLVGHHLFQPANFRKALDVLDRMSLAGLPHSLRGLIRAEKALCHFRLRNLEVAEVELDGAMREYDFVFDETERRKEHAKQLGIAILTAMQKSGREPVTEYFKRALDDAHRDTNARLLTNLLETLKAKDVGPTDSAERNAAAAEERAKDEEAENFARLAAETSSSSMASESSLVEPEPMES